MNIKLSNPKAIVGIKKVPMSAVSAPVMAEIGVAMLEGAAKYGRHNYRAVGVRSSVYYDSTMRHLMAWWEGEDVDADSGMSHVTKAITSLVVLRDAMIQGMCTDDRPPSSVEFYTALNAKTGAIIDKYADRDPRHYTIADTKAASEQCKSVEEAAESKVIPEWSYRLNAPETANFLAMDKDGKWHWFDDEPYINGSDEWIRSKTGNDYFLKADDLFRHTDDWTKSLFRRPQQ